LRDGIRVAQLSLTSKIAPWYNPSRLYDRFPSFRGAKVAIPSHPLNECFDYRPKQLIIFRRKFVNKSELVEALAASANMSKTDSAEVIDSLVDIITGALKSGGSVSISGFGTFSVSDRAARTGRNPQTGAAIDIPAAKIPKFKAGKALKDAVN
jgi:DNA-binding protein HU-beta